MYLNILFALLVFEMSLLFLLVLPLPFRIRRMIVDIFERILKFPQLKTITSIGYVLVGILFLDSWKRTYSVSFRNTFPVGKALSEDRMTATTQEYVSRTYNQRNLYLSGFLLYFNVCIPTVVNILRSMIRHKEQNCKSIKTAGSNSKKLMALRKELSEKEVSLEAMRKQKANLDALFDSASEVADSSTSARIKKKE